MMRVILITLSFLCFQQFGWSQVFYAKDLDKKQRKQFDKAVKYQKEKNYQKAITEFDKVLNKNPELVEALARKASIYYAQKNYEPAIEAFENAIEVSPKVDKRLIFSLATAARENLSFDKAAKTYDRYLTFCKTENRNCTLAKKYKTQALFAIEAMKNPVSFVPERLPDSINTNYSEYLPAFTADGSRMIFTRRVGTQEDFFESQIVRDTFRNARFLETLNTAYNEGAHAISVDGNYLVYTICNSRLTIGSCDLYQSKRIKGYWTTPTSMGDNINSISWDAQPSLSADGKSLYYSSKRRGGIGGSDIWVTHKNARGKWSSPLNVGNKINTPGSEESPFIHPDGKTLYFRSNSHPGMGDFDIFVSRLDENGDWSNPINLGYPINSPNSEGALHVSLDGLKAYYASDHHFKFNDPNKNLDIFSFDLPQELRPNSTTYMKVLIYDQNTQERIGAELLIKDLNTDKEILKQELSPTDKFLTTMTIGNNYYISVKAEGYLYHSENVNLDSLRRAIDPYIMNIYLNLIPEKTEVVQTKVEAPKPIILQNIFFESGSAKLKEISFTEINNLAEQLKSNPNLKIRIIGHTDNVGNESDNMKLSNDRAKSVHQALIQTGIKSNQVSYLGKGETEPIDTNDTEEGRQNNRRTEFVVVGEA